MSETELQKIIGLLETQNKLLQEIIFELRNPLVIMDTAEALVTCTYKNE